MPRKLKKKNAAAHSLSTELAVPMRTIKFHSIKAADFRAIHADGMWASLSAQEQFHLIFYSERAPIPREATYIVNENGTLGGEMAEKRVIRDGLIRELEIDVVLSVKAATQVHDWLGKALESLAKAETNKSNVPEEPGNSV